MVEGREQVEDEDFTAFFRREFPRLVLHLGLRGFAQYAQDAADEAMGDAFKKWHDIENPAAWVRTVATRYAARDQRRDRQRDECEYIYTRAILAAEIDAPHTLMELSEQHRTVLEELKKLPERRRAVVALLVDGYTICEIAHALETTEATVRSHLRHARRNLASLGRKIGGAA